jgi:hypothetical protein
MTIIYYTKTENTENTETTYLHYLCYKLNTTEVKIDGVPPYYFLAVIVKPWT